MLLQKTVRWAAAMGRWFGVNDAKTLRSKRMQKQTEFGYAELQVKSIAKYHRKRSRNKAARSAAKPRTASFTPNHHPIAAAQRTVFCNKTTILNPYYRTARTFTRNAPPYNFSSFEVKNRNAAALRNAVCLSERSERV